MFSVSSDAHAISYPAPLPPHHGRRSIVIQDPGTRLTRRFHSPPVPSILLGNVKVPILYISHQHLASESLELNVTKFFHSTLMAQIHGHTLARLCHQPSWSTKISYSWDHPLFSLPLDMISLKKTLKISSLKISCQYSPTPILVFPTYLNHHFFIIWTIFSPNILNALGPLLSIPPLWENSKHWVNPDVGLPPVCIHTADICRATSHDSVGCIATVILILNCM